MAHVSRLTRALDMVALETFAAVVRSGNLTNASRHLYVSQSTVSQRIARLESILGFTLFDRSRGMHEVGLTAAGQDLMALATRWEELFAQADTIGLETWINLAIGAPASVNTFVLGNVYRRLIEIDSPRLRLRIETSSSASLYEMLSRTEVDLAVVGFERASRDILLSPLLTEPMVLVTGTLQPPVTRHGLVSPESLDPARELRANWGPAVENWRQQWWNSRSAVVEVDPAFMVTPLLKKFDCWMIVPGSMALALQPEGFRIYGLLPAPPRRTLYLALRRHITPRLERAIDAFRDAVNTELSAFRKLLLDLDRQVGRPHRPRRRQLR